MSSSTRLITRPFVFLTLAQLMQGLGYSSMLLLPLFLNHLEASRSEIGLIMASAGVGGLLLRPLVGWALDRVGRKPVIVAGTICTAIGMGLIGLVDAIGPLIYAIRFLIGIGVGALFTSYFALASDVVPASRRTEGLALFGISGLLPLMVNPFAASIGVSGSEIGTFIPAVGLVIMSSLVFLAFVPENRAPPEPDSGAGSKGGVWAAISAPQLRSVWTATIAFASLVSIFFVFATVTAESFGMERPSEIWFGYALAAASVRLFGAKLPDRLGTHNMIAPAISLYVLAAIIIAGAENENAFHIAAILAGMSHGYTFPVLVSQVVSRVPERNRGASLAFYTGLWDVCGLVIAPLAGSYADSLGDDALFATAALMGTLLLFCWAWLEHKNGPTADRV